MTPTMGNILFGLDNIGPLGGGVVGWSFTFVLLREI
jgi:hypothetical protein